MPALLGRATDGGMAWTACRALGADAPTPSASKAHSAQVQAALSQTRGGGLAASGDAVLGGSPAAQDLAARALLAWYRLRLSTVER